MRELDPTLKSVRLANYIVALRKELLGLARACGVDHPGLVSPDQLEFLDDRFGARTVADMFGSRRGNLIGWHGRDPVANRVTLGSFDRGPAGRDGQTQA